MSEQESSQENAEAVKQENIASVVHPQPQTPEEIREVMEEPTPRSEEEQIRTLTEPAETATLHKATAPERARRKKEIGEKRKAGQPLTEEERAIEAAEAFATGQENKPLTELESAQAELARAQAKSLKPQRAKLGFGIEQNYVSPLESSEIFTPSIIPAPQVGSVSYQVEGEQRAHPSLPELRANLVQQFLAIPVEIRGNAGYSLPSEEKDAITPEVMSILKTLELMKRVSPDISIDNEIESLELPDDSHVETFLTLVNENMGDAIKDYYNSIKSNLTSNPSHVEKSIDSSIHASDEMANNLPVQILNSAGKVVLPEGEEGILGQTTIEEIPTSSGESESERDSRFNIITGEFEPKKVRNSTSVSESKLDRKLAKLAKQNRITQKKLAIANMGQAVQNAEKAVGYLTEGRRKIRKVIGVKDGYA